MTGCCWSTTTPSCSLGCPPWSSRIPGSVVATARSSRDVGAPRRHVPDVAVLDLQLPDGDGITLGIEVKQRWPELRVLVLTMNADEATVMRSLGAVASTATCSRTPTPRTSWRRSTPRRAARWWWAAASARFVVAAAASAPRTDALAALDTRDLEILELLVDGLPTSQVAARLFLAPKTIRNRISDMLGKLGVATREEAIALGRAAGLGAGGPRGFRHRVAQTSRPGTPSPRSRGTRRGRSSGARRARVTATRWACSADVVAEVASILDIPLESGPPPEGRQCDRLVAVPFRQVGERGFEAHDDGTPLVVVEVETEREFSVADVVDAIDDVAVDFVDRGGFETDDDDYAKVVEAIIEDEIGQGEGANLVIGRHYRATVADWGADKALAVFRRLLERERGAYWTYCFFTGDRYLSAPAPSGTSACTAATCG